MQQECVLYSIHSMGVFCSPSLVLTDMEVYIPSLPRTTRLDMILCVSVPNLHDCLLDREEYHGQRAVDENVHMNRHRVIARGNATFFSLL
jgi:hypothetical protein